MTALCLVLAGVLAAPTLNLLPDPGFEGEQWELAKWDHGTSQHEFTTPGRTGDKCVHLVGLSSETGRINELGISPVLPVTAGDEYLFAVRYRSTAEAGPHLSVITYREPFATASWKTPQAQYDSRYLPASETWRLGLWRFQAKPGAVEMRVMVRLAGEGEVWYDDASLAQAGSFGIQTTAGGDVKALPDGRVYEADVSAPADQEWTVALLDATDRELGGTEGKGARQGARVEFQAATGDKLSALLRVGDAAVDYAEFTAPPLLEVALLSSRYRNAIYDKSRPAALAAELRAHATPEVYGNLKYSVAVVPADEEPKTRQWRTMTAAVEGLALGPADLGPGDWRLLVEVQGAPGVEALEVPLKVLPPGDPHEVTIDDANRLLVDGKPLFPCGFYGAPDDEDRTRPIADAGYNAVLTYNSNPEWCRKWLDLCQRLGLWGIVHLPRPFVDKFDEDKLREAIRVVKNHPALLAYYLIDEPSPSQANEKPGDLKRVYDVLCDEDPYHPVTICINVPANEALYLDCYDVVMIDVYPVTFSPRPLTDIADRMDHAWKSTAGRKPVWFIPQTFGYDVVEGLDRDPTWLTPTPAQERVMQYLSLAHGARGSIAYCYHVYTGYDAEAKKAGKWPWKLGGYLPEKQPALWGSLVDLGADYRALQQALVQPQWATTSLADGKLHVGWYYGAGGKAWLLVVNADEQQTVEADVSPLPDGAGRAARATDVLRARDLPVRDGKVHLSLPAMGTAAVELELEPR